MENQRLSFKKFATKRCRKDRDLIDEKFDIFDFLLNDVANVEEDVNDKLSV